MIKRYIGIAKRTGECFIVTPLYVRSEEPLDNVSGYSISLNTTKDEPSAYILEHEDELTVFGPSILENGIELIGEI